MKLHKIGYGLVALAAGVVASSASASILAGFYQFDGTKAKPVSPPTPGNPPTMSNIMADIWLPGITAWMISPIQAAPGNNGSYDGTYGVGFSTTDAVAGASGSPQSPSANNAPGDGAANLRITSAFTSNLGFYFRNDTLAEVPLGYFCFDIADIATGANEHNRFDVNMFVGELDPNNTYALPATDPGYMASVFTSSTQTTLYSSQPVVGTKVNDYKDYCKLLDPVVLAPGETVMFEFLVTQTQGIYPVDTVWVDNIALTAIPEPGSVLGLGCVLASGLLLRNRRRK